LWAFKLSAVREPALEVLRLVGAESEDLLAGIVGGKSIVRTESSPEPAGSDSVLFRGGRVSKYPGSLNFEEFESGAELRDMLRLVFRLLVDLKDGAFDDLVDEWRSGITTTGIPPLFKTSRRAFLLEVLLTVPFDC
jgi:hypothetical protein